MGWEITPKPNTDDDDDDDNDEKDGLTISTDHLVLVPAGNDFCKHQRPFSMKCSFPSHFDFSSRVFQGSCFSLTQQSSRPPPTHPPTHTAIVGQTGNHKYCCLGGEVDGKPHTNGILQTFIHPPRLQTAL